jgi:ABC-2 type transport system ATP-binding protein
MSMIELAHFGKDYGDFTAVDSLDLKIEAGELFGFIGPNGAGKSTTIRFLATLLRPTRGDGTINGFSVTRQPLEVRRSIGYMPDAFGVYDGMKVWEFLDFFAVAYKIGKSQRKQVIGDVLELLDLTYKRDAYVNSLSRGMKQRLCLAKTLVHEPPVLILDEPTSGLDPRARIEVKALLKELKQMGKTILISSHVLSELADCCTSIGIIERGKLLMHGPISEVYSHIRSHAVIQIRVNSGVDRALSLVRSQTNIRDVWQDGNVITVEFSSGEDDPGVLLRKLIESGIDLRSYSEKEPTLEDVFMTVTQGLVA